ncbi:MAG: hypothetical protein IPH13_13710 [Planctomycetes bacterium]|nr:hypothetical protein [Planctomycetota bacterium]
MTILEVTVALMVVAIAIFPMLEIREKATISAYAARNNNIATSLARQLLSEIEFRGISPLSGQFDNYPGFSYEAEITLENIVTGEKEEDQADKNKKYKNKDQDDATYKPADATDPNEEDEDDTSEYNLRRVHLTIKYPNFGKPDEMLQLKIETLMPPLPDKYGDKGLSKGKN